MNLAVTIGKGKKIQGTKNLDRDTRCVLLQAFQNAISMQSELWIATSSLADTLDCTLECVKDAIRGFAITADTGLELDEMDLHGFLGEPEAEGYVRIGGPLEAQVRH